MLPKHKWKSTSDWLKRGNIMVLEWPSPDLDPIEMLWQDLKWAVPAQKPSSVHELNQFYKKVGHSSSTDLQLHII